MELSNKYPHRLVMGKTVLLFFLAVFDQILFILAGNVEILKSLSEFDFGQI